MTENGKLKDIKVKGRISIGPLTVIINEDQVTPSINLPEVDKEVRIEKKALFQSIDQLSGILQKLKALLEQPNAGD